MSKQLTDKEIDDIRDLLRCKEDIQAITEDRRAYTRVASKLRSGLGWITFTVGAGVLVYNSVTGWLIDLINKS